MKKRSILYRMTGIVMALSVLSGCGQEKKPTSSEAIELLEPVTASANIEKVARRDLYDYETFVGVICPETEVYSFEDNVTFSHFTKYPGESVEAGEVLAYADSTALSEEIEQMEETLEELTEVYEDDLKRLAEQISAIQDIIDTKAEWATIAIGQEEQLMKEISFLELDIAELYGQIDARKALYDLDYSYYSGHLEALKAEGTKISVRSKEAGVIVALGDYDHGNWISEGSGVVAIADESVKRMRCEYITPDELEEAADVYAVIDGKRYEVEYIPYEQEEYESALLAGKTLYSTFVIVDPADEVEFGSLVAIALIHEAERDALSVPVSALHNDEGGTYVYRVEDGENVKAYIEEGYTDDVYVQVLSGVNEGDPILLPDYTTLGEETMQLVEGEFSTSFWGGGHVVYPDYEVVTYDVEYGAGQFVQYEVQRYDTVQAGDLLATITVEGDDILIQEKELQLQRMQERLLDMDTRIKDTESEMTHKEREVLYEQMVIATEDIAELTQEITEMKSDYATTKIYANASGIVIWMTDKQNGSPLDYGENLVFIASPDTCYLEVSNTQHVLNYGNEMFVQYWGEGGQIVSIPTTVLTAPTNALSGELSSELAYLQLPEEILARIEEMERLQTGNYYEQHNYDVVGNPRTIANVILIPKRAVFVEEGQTYVYVLEENGDITARSFIAGGYDVENYWVLEGLEEGMTICLE